MNTFKIIFATISSMLLINISHAQELASGPFYLQGGIIPQGKNPTTPGKFELSLLSLPSNATFTLTCDIINQNYNKLYPIVISITGWESATFITVNGVSSQSRQYLLNNLINKLSAKILLRPSPSGSYNGITFYNFDTSDQAQISNCIAVYSTQ